MEMQKLTQLYANQHLQQFVKFCFVGVSNTVIDAAIYIGLTRGSVWFAEHYLIAAILAFIVAGLNSFYWNRRWTFAVAHTYTHGELAKFYMANGVAFIVNTGLLWLLVSGGMFDIAAKLLAGVTAGGMNFLMQKLWAFAAHEIEELEEAFAEHDADQ